MGGWLRGWDDGKMGWVVCMCAMMLAVLLFVGCADVCGDGCGIDMCIDVGRVHVCIEVRVLDPLDHFPVPLVGGVCWSGGFQNGIWIFMTGGRRNKLFALKAIRSKRIWRDEGN